MFDIITDERAQKLLRKGKTKTYIGEVWEYDDSLKCPEQYIVANVTSYVFGLINIKDGNRFCSPIFLKVDEGNYDYNTLAMEGLIWPSTNEGNKINNWKKYIRGN